MSNQRGLTLLEVLLATALLTLIAASTAPLITQARASLDLQIAPDVHVELQELADQLLNEPKALGIDDIHQIEHVEINWPDAPQRDPIHIIRLVAEDSTVDSVWFIIEWQESFVLRCVPKPDEDEES